MTYQEILFDIDDGIATITLNDPQTRNALGPEMRDELRDAVGVIKDSAGDAVKAVILTGAGGAFCAGGNVKNMGGGTARGPAGRSRMRKSHELIYDLLHLEVPVVSLVDGPAAGVGCNLALLADFVLATPSAYFMQAFARIGLVPDWGGFFVLPRLVGLQRAKELIYSGRRVYAEEAKDLGMILDIVDQDNAMAAARDLAGRFCHASTAAIGVSKNILNQSFNQDFRSLMEMEAMGQTLVRDTDFHREAVRRFKEKDTPLYDWEALAP